MTKMIFAIGIGTNIGNRIINIENAIKNIENENINILKKSLIYQNEALVLEEDIDNQDLDINFFNMVILCESNHQPRELLKILKDIESKMGRIATSKWQPRIIDLDLLFFDDIIIDEHDIIIPHYDLTNRSFVILPLLQIAGTWRHPNKNNEFFNKTIAQIYHEKFSSLDNEFINTIPMNPKIMAIINITPDSCTNDGYLSNSAINSEKICKEIWKKFEDGASVLDFGAQSTRPNNNEIVDPYDEISRMKLIMDDFFKNYYFKSKIIPEISIDTFYPEVIKYCIENYHVDIINDVSGLNHIELLDFIINSNRKIVLTHNLGIPNNIRNIVNYEEDIVKILVNWFEKKINQILQYKGGLIKKDQIILDPGIGFGKSAHHSWEIVKNIDQIKKHFNMPILIGHSKKSLLKVIGHGYEERQNQTLGISISVADSVDYLRVHDVKLNAEALSGYYFGK